MGHRVAILLFSGALVASCAATSPTLGGQGGKTLACELQPSQVHLALTGERSEMIVSWTNVCHLTALGGNETFPSYFVEYWQQDGGRKRNASARRTRYFRSWHQSALLKELKPGTKTCYRIYASEQDKTTRCFLTEASDLDSFSFIHVADWGVSAAAQRTLASIKAQEKVDLFLHTGDIGYGDDRIGGPETYEAIYDQFMDGIQDMAQTTPYMTCPGNHDVSCKILTDFGCPVGHHNFAAFRNRFQMPYMWYSFTYGNVRFVMVNSEADYPDAPTNNHTIIGGKGGGFGDQLKWLNAELRAARDSGQFIVVGGHRPLYSTKGTDWPLLATDNFRKHFGALFKEYSVHLYLGGHVHNYERFRPSDEKSPVSVVNGAAGNMETVNSRGAQHLDLLARGVYDNGYLIFHVNSTTIEGRFVGSRDGTILDRFAIHHRNYNYHGSLRDQRITLQQEEI